MDNKRYRSFSTSFRAADSDSDSPDKPTKFVGIAAVFDTPSVDLGGWCEIIKPGAFSNALASPDLDVIANVDHSENVIDQLGRSTSGTLRLAETPEGLVCEIDIPDTETGRTTAVLIGRGDVSQMSFCFVPIRWEETTPGVHEITECTLHDVAIVVHPAYVETHVELRSKPFVLDLCRRRLELLSKKRNGVHK